MNENREHRVSRPVRLIIWLVCAVMFLCIGMIGFVLIREKGVKSTVPAADSYDAIIVLGAQVLPDGTPNVQLAWRLDAAVEAYWNKKVPVVVCGAQGKDEPLPEAYAMKKYLIDRGVAEEDILTDPESFNTRQNLRNAKELLKDKPEVQKVLVVTSDYHVPRSLALAKDQGYEATGLGSPCKPDYWVKNHAREALAWIKYWGVKYLHLPLE
jgi:uncharacterized SAM-binding protein YcdF (DUF218 family)